MKKRLRWNRKEDVFLIENYEKFVSKDLADEFNHNFPHRQRSVGSINQRLMKLNLRKRRRWTDAEVDYLKDRMGQVSLSEIAKYLHRSVGAVRKKLSDLGISLKDEMSDSITEIANKIGCSSNLIYAGIKAEKLLYHGRTNKVSGAYLISIQDVRDFIVYHYSDRWFKCYECGKPVLGDMYTKDCIPAGFKKPKPEPTKFIEVKEDYRDRFLNIIDRTRLNKKISSTELSEALGYNPQWYTSFKKNDSKNFDISVMHQLSSYLGMNLYIHLEEKR